MRPPAPAAGRRTGPRSAALASLLALGVAGGASPARAQSVRTQDVGLTTVRFGSNRPVLTALTLDEGLVVERERSSTTADGLVSLYHDGRWSMQGSLLGTRFSPVIPTAGGIAPLYRTIRGELSAGTAATLQQGLMPTFEALTTGRVHLLDLDRGAWGGATVARSFDGESWRTTLIADVGSWVRRGTTVSTLTLRPMQSTGGDLMGDAEGSVQWERGPVTWATTGGVRLGQAQRVTVGWLTLSASFLLARRFLVTASAGAYPEDLLQGLPAGHYAGVSVRLPSRARAAATAPAPTTPTRVRPTGELPDAWASAVVARFETPDSGSTRRLVRVRAPGVQRVELIGDFTDWQPVRLVRSRLGEWETTIRIPSGTHRFNIRLDGQRLVVPANVGRVADEFSGVVGVVVVP